MQSTSTRRRRRDGAPAAPDTEAAASAVDPHAERLCANIRRLAATHDLSLAELGRLIGQPNGNALYNLQNGWSDSLSARTLMRLADVFGVTLDALTGRRPDAALPDGHEAPAAVWQTHKIAAGLGEAGQAMQTAREAIDSAERALRAAAALLPSSRPADWAFDKPPPFAVGALSLACRTGKTRRANHLGKRDEPGHWSAR